MIADDFFQAAFGGSFLNHQWLIAAATPTYRDTAPARPALDHRLERHADGVPALHADRPGATRPTHAGLCRRPCRVARAATTRSTRCSRRTSRSRHVRREAAPQTAATIGDRLTAAGVEWAWYSGGWSNAAGVRRRPGWTNGTGRRAPTRTRSPTRRTRTARTALPVPPPAVRLLRRTYAPGTPGRDAPAGRGRSSSRRSPARRRRAT